MEEAFVFVLMEKVFNFTFLTNCKILFKKNQHDKWNCCRKGDTFQRPKLGSCLTLGNELSEETHMLTKQEIFLGKVTRVESRRVREPRRAALPGLKSQVLW